MTINQTALIDNLEKVYTALQKLNTALAIADARRIFELVEEVNRLTRGVDELDSTALDDKEAARVHKLMERIRSIQSMNQALCNGGLRTLLWCAELAGRDSAYDLEGHVEVPVAVSGDSLSFSA